MSMALCVGRMRLLPEKSLAREEIEKMSEIEIKLLTSALDHKHKARRAEGVGTLRSFVRFQIISINRSR